MDQFINSLGMEMLPVPAGSFEMGADDSHPIDGPRHAVTLTQPFWIARTPVTNAQYEQFDPLHRAARGQVPFSAGDGDAAVFVSWDDAVSFAAWLSRREGRIYLLPTEAEWEYAARAGSAAPYPSGERLDPIYARNQRECWYPDIDHFDARDAQVRLRTGQTPPNAWGICDMNGLVEEWCADSFARYSRGSAADPAGRGGSPFRMTRGGSHSTPEDYLRSDARMGQLPGDRSWMIGLRLICMKEKRRERLWGVREKTPLWAEKVSGPEKPAALRTDAYFSGPNPFVRLTVNDAAGLHSHNHGPSVVECPNGDLLCAWFSCPRESGREMSILASRKRKGAQEWEPASVFLRSPARNLSCTVLIRQGDLLYHVNGFSACATWANVCLGVRVSADSGATWSDWRIIQPRHDQVIMPCAYAISPQGRILLSADNISVDNSVSGTGGSCYFWFDGNNIELLPGWTPGIHAPVEFLRDGTILSFGRGSEINGFMPESRSRDGGKSFEVRASVFPGIGMGQRAVLKRLPGGALFFASFASHPFDYAGGRHEASGLFGALSYDEGESFSVVRAIVPDGMEGDFSGGAWTGKFRMDASHAEPKGYLTCTVGADGVIHLLSSGLEYALTQQWLEKKCEGKGV